MEPTYNYLSKAFLKISNLIKQPDIFVYLLSAILIAIPLNYAFGSIATMLFLVVAFSTIQPIQFVFNKALLLPLAFYFLMVLSLFWTHDFKATLGGLQKELVFLFLPLPFLFVPNLCKVAIEKVIRIFSFAMVFYALYYFIKATFKYIATGNKGVFFYHELVSLDLNAIYVAVFASLGVFYFISLKNRKPLEQVSIFILAIFIFLLSSKSIIFIDFLLIICFYVYFSDIPNSVKFITVTGVTAFLVFSLVFVKEIRARFLIEYETAFVDNTLNTSIGNSNEKVYNISIQQAWTNKKFEQNNFFPGTAMRIYQIRIFKEMLQEQPVLLTGFGLEASQNNIQKKAKQHNLYAGYGDFNFHNQYVQTFAELGLFGFLILILMLFLNLKNAWQHQNFLHIVFAITMIILFLTESFFCRQRGVTFFMLLYCMFNASYPKKEKAI
jgi:O-antigen ligase